MMELADAGDLLAVAVIYDEAERLARDNRRGIWRGWLPD